MTFTIDSHHHFWDPSQGDYSWMGSRHAPINRIFAPDDFRPALKQAGVSKTVLVQTWSSFEETEAFLSLAESTDFIAGVVGWVDLTADDVDARLDALLHRPDGRWLVGIRHQVHDEKDSRWLLRKDVQRGLKAVQDRDLVFDLLIRPRELNAALQTVEAFPDLRFVVDHIAKPDIKANGFENWAERFQQFAKHRSHVWCKLSGMVTEADWQSWTPDDIKPYLDEVLKVFGPDRCMFGSDWPVCLLAADYKRTVDLVRNAVEQLPQHDRDMILSGSAIEAYRLDRVSSL